ncbi:MULTISPECIES: type I-E CRISPR-associated protein Cas5/CasD [unclassified Streptomyces]|uniref:type I-E CRISPR-associated protein Cas5/CasD n=1 Tax=unclassified Streptomyces TaxID=2593676 RepID=UPI003435A339
MTGLLLRLAGPLQSWGERSVFSSERDSAAFPTRSGLIGMFAAAEGHGRDEVPNYYGDLEFVVRIDRPGVRLMDYHTVGGGQPKNRTAATSGGDRKGAAVITHRHYLSDAVFVVAVNGPAADISRIADALHQPYWNPFLGRRSCVPDEPLVLRARTDDPVTELMERVPLSPPDTEEQPRNVQQGHVPVEFVWEHYHRAALPDDAVTTTVNDVPISFAQHRRSHGKRRVYRTTEQLPADLLANPRALHQRLVAYAKEEA